jgi:K+-sensing histidine kinase KdpD
VANVSHELKTPLSVMQNYGALLAQPELEDEKRIEYAKGITDASQRLAALITNILKLNKLENQQIAPTCERYNLSEQVCECLLLFEEAWEKKELNIETDIEEDVIIQSDAELLSLVWNNMISNAVKFTPKGGTIEATLVCRGTKLYFTVQDSGRGIPENLRSSIYCRFLRQPTLEDGRHGIGLGMVLIRAAATAHGGTVLIEQPANQGMRITMTLNIRQNKSGTLRSPILSVDYAGEWDHSLIELSDSLPAELYREENKY